MVPNITKTGTSFRGAALYYLHDKRQDGEAERLTGERVAWTSTRNLLSDDPEEAVAIMRATAADQDRLKAEAGIKASGRKSDKCVYAYSIAWHPDEKAGLTRAEMERAADESIRAIGAEHLQAVIVCHTDEPQPHVHVILNRVSPIDGRMHVYSNDRLKLSQWAEAYERERGKIWCEERVENNKRRQDGDYVRDNSPVPRSLADDYAAVAIASNDNEAARLVDDYKQRIAALSALGQQQASRHKHEWAALSLRYQEAKKQIAARYRGKDNAFTAAKARIKEQYRPAWRELFKAQNRDMRGFDKRETHLMGKLENAIAAARFTENLGRDVNRSFLAQAFNFIISAKARRAAMEALHNAQRKALSREQTRDTGRAVQIVKDEQRAAYFNHRKTFNSDRALLIDRQAAEKEDLKRKWRSVKAERSVSVESIRRQERVRKATETSEYAREAPPAPDLSKAFSKAGRPQRKRKGRVRKRERD